MRPFAWGGDPISRYDLVEVNAGENKPIRVWRTVEYESDTADRMLSYRLPLLVNIHVAAARDSKLICLLYVVEG